MINYLFKNIIFTSITGSMLFLFIISIKKLLKKIISINIFYNIWFVLILYLILPFIPIKLPITLEYNIPTTHTQFNNILKYIDTLDNNKPKNNSYLMGNSNILTNNIILNSNNIKYNSHSQINIYYLIWLSGTFIYLSYIYFINYKTKKIIRHSKKYDNCITKNIFDRCKNTMNINKFINLKSVDYIEQPCIYGLFKPTILLSEKCNNQLSSNQKKYIFLHELSHYKRKDILINWILILLKSIYWFNPIIIYAINKIKEEGELACDYLALSYLDINKHKDYAMSIIDILSIISKPKYILTTISIINNKNTIKRRIEMIFNFKKNSHSKLFISCFLVILLSIIGFITIYAINNVNFKKVESNKFDLENTKNLENKEIKSENASVINTNTLDFIWPVPNHKNISLTYGLINNATYCTEKANGKQHIIYNNYNIGNIKIQQPQIDKNTKNSYYNNGINILAPLNTNIIASEKGTVICSSYLPYYGHTIIIKHDEQIYSIYTYCMKLLAKKDTIVEKGQQIALVGSTGKAVNPCLHFMIVKDNKIINPLDCFDN